MNCELCEALKNEKYRVIAEDEYVFVMVNNEPVKDGHVMILPVRHAENLKDLTPQEAQMFLQSIDQCMETATQLYDETPMCLINGWKHRSQGHLHAHVLPSKNNLRGLYAASEGLAGRHRADQETLIQTAEKWRKIL